MPRIEPIPWEQLTPAQQQWIRDGVESGAYTDTVPLQIMAYADHDEAPDDGDRHPNFPRHLLGGRLLELLRIRSAQLGGCAPCMSSRKVEGATEELVECLPAASDNPDLSVRERLALEYLELLATDHHRIDGPVYARLAEHFTVAEIVELGLDLRLHDRHAPLRAHARHLRRRRPRDPLRPGASRRQLGAGPRRRAAAGRDRPMTQRGDGRDLSRRETLGLLGKAAGVGLAAAWGSWAPRARAAAPMSFASAGSPAFQEGVVIRTLRGDVDPARLAHGATLFHEHLFGGTVEELLYEVDAAGHDGLACLVDSATGRRTEKALEEVQAVADRTDVHIVRAGGYFEDVGFALYPVRVAEASEDELFEELVRDAAAQRWGAFGEIASSLEMRPDERKVHRAVGRAHVATGLPIFTHTPHESCPSCAMEQMDVLESVGVDFAHLAIGHMSTLKDEHDPLATHSAIARRGAFVGLDTLGHEMSRSQIPALRKVRMVQDLLEAGFEDRILFSSDMGNPNHWKANYGHGYASVLMQFVPKLLYAGVPERTIQKILVDNPRRFLAVRPRG